MVVALPNDHKVKLYSSADLKSWKPLSEFGPAGATGGQWECPELFELPVEEAKGVSRWVLKVGINPGGRIGGSSEQYFIGKFDGSRFVNDNPADLTLWTDYGKDCYCALTFNGLPRTHKPVMIGWMDNWQYAAKLPTHPWRGQMTFPRELSLRTTDEGIRLYQRPAEELEQLIDTNKDSNTTHSFLLIFPLNARLGKPAGLKILSDATHYTEVGYDPIKKSVFLDRSHSGEIAFSPDFPARIDAPLTSKKPAISMQILVDRSSVEVFADGGRVVSTNLVFPPKGAYKIEHIGARVVAIDQAIKSTF
jgi:fructan beta-fructosidase